MQKPTTASVVEAEFPQNLRGSITTRTFFSSLLRRPWSHNVYLPDDYATTNRAYPVIYLLHGSGGDEASWDEGMEVLDGLIQAGVMPRVIAVAPAAGRSWWVDTLEPQISASDVDRNGNDIFRYRVDLQYEDSGDILKRIARSGMTLDVPSGGTRSITNIVNAYGVATTFFLENFGDDGPALKRFYAFLVHRVKLIRIKTQSVAHALKIFETINDRGKGLDSMDLLKNLMFMNASAPAFERLKAKWKDLVDTLYNAPEKPLRFLRYFIFSTYDVDRMNEDEIYGWFVKNNDLCGYESNPLQFVDELLEAAKAYANFIKGKDVQGQPNRYLENISLLSGAAKQHFILLMAARKLPSNLFTELCRQVENLIFTYIITREHTREFERRFANWSNSLKKVNTEEDLINFLIEHFEPAKRNLSNRFDLTFDTLSADSIQKYRMRYLLGKLTQFVNEQAYGDAGASRNLSTFVNKQVHIEHILPQNPKAEVVSEFGDDHVEEYIPMLGNLTLAESAINTSLGNKPFALKRDVFAKSGFLLTQSIGRKVEVGINTSVDRAAKGLRPFDAWSKGAIKERQDLLSELARRVWDIPTPR